MLNFYEFFAGAGMARAGLGRGWNCLFANDIDPKKASSYVANWGSEGFFLGDVSGFDADDIFGQADLAWASFPCQDLSLAGNYRGLLGNRSGVFWAFWRLVKKLKQQRRAPRIVAIENVIGLLSSNNGRDFQAIVTALVDAGFRVGACVIDTALFLPQSRPRLFILGIDDSVEIPEWLLGEPKQPWHSDRLLKAYHFLSDSEKRLGFG